MSPDETHAEKARLRAELLAARRQRSAGDLEQARAALRAVILPRVSGLSVVAAYLPMRTEPGSVELLAGLAAQGVRVLVPVTMPDRDLDWAPWSVDGVGAGMGVDAITATELVLAPALAVASDGTRLGRGGGSYDRALSRLPRHVRVAALVFDDEVVDSLPRNRWDVPVAAAATPGGWIELAGNPEMRPDR
ncbi:MAG TPA: 5-formyltetrahydrofolate cyclo-ligase [Jatrophihabitans sp.]|nr:5-formyltetrahydrofolate cyclo-ligase [Jatrophihabitans sp.]